MARTAARASQAPSGALDRAAQEIGELDFEFARGIEDGVVGERLEGRVAFRHVTFDINPGESIGVIPFDQCATAAACSSPTFTSADLYYGNNAIITKVQFLTQHKLLVLLSDQNNPSQQGIYIFDLTVNQTEPGYYYNYGTSTTYAPPNGP